MATVGRALLIVAFAVALYGIGASLYGALSGDRRFVDSGRRAVYALAGLLTGAFLILELAFLRDDFSFTLVSTHSSTTTPAFYKATAAWSSQEGSLLLWVLLLSVWSSIVLYLTRRRVRQIAPVATAVLLAFASFFLTLILFLESPFTTLAQAPPEGTGLNPLLRHPAMMFHPPMLYSGYTLFSIPFAFAVGALVTRRLNNEWLQATRRFALAAWLFLGIGIVLGARWSYTELGWGGYWAWDPVENASLLPWLTGTAFIHSIMIQERRGMLKVWNASLVLATGTLAILGTFLVRSGILDSIHAFGASTLGVPFLILIGAMVLGSVALVVWRRADLASEHRLDSLLSREAVFLLQNVILVALAFVVWWGTFFPLISEAVTGTRSLVGGPWFDDYTVPLAIALVALSGVGPLVPWRRLTFAGVRRGFVLPTAVALATALALLAVPGAWAEPKAAAFAGIVAFVLASVAQELWRGMRARQASAREPAPVALASVVRRNRRRYGGYIVHAGFATLLLGVALSTSFQHARDVTLRPGQSTRIDGFDVRYVRATSSAESEKISLGAVLDVSKDGRHVTTLRTTRGYYPSQDLGLGIVGRFFGGENVSEVGLRAGLGRDIWAVIAPDIRRLEPIIEEGNRTFRRAMVGIASDGGGRREVAQLFALRDQAVVAVARRFETRPWPTTFRLIVWPFATWIWIGTIVTVLGALLALWPAPAAARRRVTAGYAARVARELARTTQ
jgi:cytochrome c-type biogenesis protein CcmF